MDLKMTNKGIATIAGIIFMVILVFGLIIKNISVDTKTAGLESEFIAQNKVIENRIDVSYKKIKETAKITRELTKEEKEFYNNYITQKVSKDDNLLFKMLSETNPKLTTDAYMRLLYILDTEREAIFAAQNRAIDIERQYQTIINSPIDGFFANRRKTLDKGYTVISSDNTKEIIKTRADNEELI